MHNDLMQRARFAALVLAAGVTFLPAAPAEAQSGRCGSSVVLSFGESLNDIAKRCGTTVSDIMDVNPLIPNPGFVFPGLKIQMPAPPPPTTLDYVFRRGDTLLTIARAYGITLGDIYRLNPEIDASTLRPGDIVTLPANAAPPPLPPPPPVPQTVRYRVQAGDTVASIARAQNVAQSDIYRLNPGIRFHPRPGSIIVLPAPPPPPPPPPPPVNTTNYVVRPGDTIYSIARANGMTVPEVLALNPNFDASRLRAGDVIRVRGGIVPPPAPPPAGGVDASVTPGIGPTGMIVQVTASGFKPSTTLRLMAGSEVATLQEFQQTTTDARGNATMSVRIPDWAAGPGTLVFAYETLDGRLRAVTDTFRVAAIPAPPPPSNNVRVVGTLTREGVECQAMRGDDGKLYTLAGRSLGDFYPGDRVAVEGKIADVSTCQQGVTIAVTRIEPAAR